MSLTPAEQLTLFEAEPESATAAPAPAPRLATPPPLAPESPVPIARPSELASGARWREVETPAQAIGFVLRRSRRNSIGLTVGDDGIVVTAPKWVTLAQVDGAVREKARWLLDKMRQRHRRQQQLAVAETQWRDGGRVPYLGQPIVLRLGHAGHGHVLDGDAAAPQAGQCLRLALPADAEQARVRDTVHAWLQNMARQRFEPRLQHFLQRSGATMQRWRLSSANTRWGSCNSDGNIMLNWRLIHFEPAIIDYVVAHEVAHLRHLHHGPAFWQEVERLLPGFESARQSLRNHHPATLPLL